MDQYASRLEIRIDWSEIDAFGHINNLAIMKYAQSARANYLDILGLMKMQAEQKKGPILASISCQFKKPLYYPGNVTVRTKVDTIKNTSFGLMHDIFNDKGELVAQACDIIVFYDFSGETKLAIPQELRDRLETCKAGV
jgi:acyl-CoA thioester hydrolase